MYLQGNGNGPGGALILGLLVTTATIATVQAQQQQQAYFPSDPSLGNCTDDRGRAQKCSPPYKNIAFGLNFVSSSTCGEYGPVEYCVQSGALGLRRACDICNAASPRHAHPTSALTDLSTNEDETWWQSESMYEVYPNHVNLTLELNKAFDIIHITMKFHSARPDSLAIYKRTSPTSDWTPFQFFSQSCRDTYSLPDTDSVVGSPEGRAICKSEYTEHTPLTGGSVVFATLEGRPSASNFENSRELNEWVTASAMRISLDRMNTFGDDVFGDEKVLRSYYYAISDITIGGTCKCNGHARECTWSGAEGGERDPRDPRERERGGGGRLVCLCEHHTAGVDCERCLPSYNDRPWARATSLDAHECRACNCNGFSARCHFNRTLYEATGHGGYCTDCEGNRDGPNCERCKPDFYQDEAGRCVHCRCNERGSLSTQCNSNGQCTCRPGVGGEKCSACLPDHYGWVDHKGCTPCDCNVAGSLDNSPVCDSTGTSLQCRCKANVEGRQCEECKLGHFNLDLNNEFGCTPCFCYNHTSVCRSSGLYGQVLTESTFTRSTEKWTGSVPLKYSVFTQSLELTAPDNAPQFFLAPDRFLGDQLGSYNQYLNFTLRIGEHGPRSSSDDIILEGAGQRVSRPIFGAGADPLPSTRNQVYSVRLHEAHQFGWNPRLTSREFMAILSNLTSIKVRGTYTPRGTGFLDNVALLSARIGSSGAPAPWMEQCTCPDAYEGNFCEGCTSGYTRKVKNGGKFSDCVACSCHGHTAGNFTTCDPENGRCICIHNTAGDNCEKCGRGFYGNARRGKANDCEPCPCPPDDKGDVGACIQLGDGNIVCLECPVGYAGPKCEVCGDGYFGDPGAGIPCKPCACNGNIDANAVGNCHRTTGECLKCIHNTGGAKCDKCLPGFWGDALAFPHSDCRPCLCSPVGSITAFCNQNTGQCPCKPAVTGLQCDTCDDGYFDLASGDGCKFCDCDLTGSFNGSCDPLNGQCRCRPGVVGRGCRECGPNMFGFGLDGCQHCDCDPIGALGLQCSPDGQCSCRDNVEGRRCDRCKENKHSRHLGCVDCPHCYNLVRDAVNTHRATLGEMERLLEDIRSAPTVVSDKEFEQKLQRVMDRVNKVWGEARGGAGASAGGSGEEKGTLDKVRELRARLSDLSSMAGDVSGVIGSCSATAGHATGNLTQVEATVAGALEDLKRAQRLLDQEGESALSSAQSVASAQSQSSQTLSDLARQSRLLAEAHETSAAEIEAGAADAVNKSSTAHEIARSAISLQLDAKNEAKLLLKAVSILEDEVRSTKVKAEESLAKAKEAYTDALDLFKDASGVRLPEVDLDAIRAKALTAKGDAERVEGAVKQLLRAREQLLREAEEEAAVVRNELGGAVKYQQIAEDLMGDLDKAKAEAEEARSQSEAFKEASDIYGALLDFNRNVDENKAEAAEAERRIPAIQRAIQETDGSTAENQRDLLGAQRLAKKALSDAEEAKAVAERASSESTTIRESTNATRTLASNLRDSTGSVSGHVTATGARLSSTETRTADEETRVKAALDRASEAQSTTRDTHDKVQSAMNSLREIQLALDNLPEIDSSTLNSLESQVSAIERQYAGAKLEEKLGELRSARNEQSKWLRSYEDELGGLRKEVENVEAIRNTLPSDSKCWRTNRLEP